MNRINILSKIVRNAGEAILNHYNDDEKLEIELKKDESPLTLADKAANAIICAGLKENFPEIPIISEENKEIPYRKRIHYDKFWLVDPLDGTKEFIKGNGEFTVNIALIENEMPVLGIVYVPVSKNLYYAEKNKGAYIAENPRRPLKAKAYHKSDKNLIMVCSRSHINEDTRAFLSDFEEIETIALGSSLKFLIIAEGKAHIYPRLGPTMEWDTAAAQIILEEAGGSVVKFETQQALRYNKKSLLNPYFIAKALDKDS